MGNSNGQSDSRWVVFLPSFFYSPVDRFLPSQSRRSQGEIAHVH